MTFETPNPESSSPPRRSPLVVSRTVAAALVVVIVLVAAGAVALARSSSAAPGSITVTGSGSVKGTPDTVTVQLGVQTTASSATLALNENSARVAALIHALEHTGIKARDLQTSGLDVYQVTNSAGVVTGFSVDNSLTVTIHNPTRAGRAIDAAANAVGNGIQLNGITLSISDDSALLASARAKAMHNARTAASQIARAGGSHLGAVRSIVDLENSNSYVYPMFSSAKASADALRSVPIQAGTQSVSVQVKVVFAL